MSASYVTNFIVESNTMNPDQTAPKKSDQGPIVYNTGHQNV